MEEGVPFPDGMATRCCDDRSGLASHNRLKRQVAELELFLDIHDPALECLREAEEMRARIEDQDPETLRRALARICHNEQLMPCGAAKNQYGPVGRLQALAAPWFNTRLRPNGGTIGPWHLIR